jgi:3-oxoacyl-(acyl-carrier-protein) synthase
VLASDRLAIVVALAEHLGEASRRGFQLRSHVGALMERLGFAPHVSLEPLGHAGGAAAMVTAAQILSGDHADVVLAGGLDTYYDASRVEELEEAGRIFDGENLDSFLPGEGGAFAVLSRPETARRLGWATRAVLTSAEVGREPVERRSGLSSGAGLASTVQRVADVLGRRSSKIEWMIGDVTNERYRTHELQLAFPRFTNRRTAPDAFIEFLPPLLGDLGAATLPTAMAVAAEGFLRGDPTARNCLAWACSDGPARGALLMERPT